MHKCNLPLLTVITSNLERLTLFNVYSRDKRVVNLIIVIVAVH